MDFVPKNRPETFGWEPLNLYVHYSGICMFYIVTAAYQFFHSCC